MPPEEDRTSRSMWPWAEADFVRVRHMLDAAEQIEVFTRDRTHASLLNDEIATLGLVKAIEIIGEAAFALNPNVRDAIRNVPWPQVIGMRHRLVHAYFDVDLDIVWATATKAVPELAFHLHEFLTQWKSPQSD